MKSSVTIRYPSKYASAYDDHLTKLYGEPDDKSESSNGKKFTIPEGIYVTNYCKTSKDSTLFIQGNQKLFEYVEI